MYSSFLPIRQSCVFRACSYRVNVKGKLLLKRTSKVPLLYKIGHKIMKIILYKTTRTHSFIWKSSRILFTESLGAGFLGVNGKTLLIFFLKMIEYGFVKLLFFIQGYFWLKIMLVSFGKAKWSISHRIFLSERRKLTFKNNFL